MYMKCAVLFPKCKLLIRRRKLPGLAGGKENGSESTSLTKQMLRLTPQDHHMHFYPGVFLVIETSRSLGLLSLIQEEKMYLMQRAW